MSLILVFSITLSFGKPHWGSITQRCCGGIFLQMLPFWSTDPPHESVAMPEELNSPEIHAWVYSTSQIVKILFTQVKIELVNSCMSLFMIIEIARLWKWLSTQITFEWLYWSMFWFQFNRSVENKFLQSKCLGWFWENLVSIWMISLLYVFIYIYLSCQIERMTSYICHIQGVWHL